MSKLNTLVIALLLVCSCDNPVAPRENATTPPLTPSSVLVDARNGGAQGFYFLPPIGRPATYMGVFDPGRSPVVEICALVSGTCASPVGRFTKNARDTSQAIHTRRADQAYEVEWNTKQFRLNAGLYRLRIIDSGAELGHADIALVARASDAKNAESDVVRVVNGSTLPIRFRIETRTATVARLEIHPSTFLLPGQGSTHRLGVRAFDASGNPVSAGDVVWESSKPGVISMTTDGTAIAVSPAGSAQITARSGSVSSNPALGIVTRIPAGATLVGDENVILRGSLASATGFAATDWSTAIVPVDPGAQYEPGWQYKVLLAGISPSVGDILIGDGEAPVGGRVMNVSPITGGAEVTLAIMPVSEMLPGLTLDEELRISPENVVHKAPAMSRSFTFATSLGTSAFSRDILTGEVESQIGPFECKLKSSGLSLIPTVTNTSFHADPDLSLLLNYSPTTGLQQLVVHGAVDAGITAKIVFPLAITETVECEAELAEVHLPIGGPLAFIFGGVVPIGVGFGAEAKLTNGEYGFDFGVTAGITMDLGVDCSSTCGAVASIDGSKNGYINPILPTFSNAAKDELSASAFGFAKLDIGNGFLQALRFEAVKAQAGLKQTFDIASKEMQTADTTYASNFKLSFDIEAGTGSSVEKVAKLLKIVLPELKLSHSTPLAESPKLISFTISPARVRAIASSDTDQKASFILSIDEVNYFGGYSIDSIELYRRKTTLSGDSLSSVPVPCGSISAVNGQSLFSCDVALPKSWAGAQDVYAFVKPKLFGVALPVLLELSGNAKATVTVDTASVSVSPSSASVAAGGTQQFSATVIGMSSSDVTWSATGGTISASGLFTAGSVAGNYTVTATSVVDASKKGSASVTVGAQSVAVVVSPDSVTLNAGSGQQFTALVTGASNGAVVWTTNDPFGTITSSGYYTAGAGSGIYTVTATSVEDPSAKASSTIIIGGTDLLNLGIDANVHAIAQGDLPGCDSLIWSPTNALVYQRSTSCAAGSASASSSQSWSISSLSDGTQLVTLSLRGDGSASSPILAIGDGSSHANLCFSTPRDYNFTISAMLTVTASPVTQAGYSQVAFVDITRSAFVATATAGDGGPLSATLSQTGSLPRGSYCLFAAEVAYMSSGRDAPSVTGWSEVRGLELRLTVP